MCEDSLQVFHHRRMYTIISKFLTTKGRNIKFQLNAHIFPDQTFQVSGSDGLWEAATPKAKNRQPQACTFNTGHVLLAF